MTSISCAWSHTWAREYGINRASERTGRGDLLERQVRKRGDEAFGSTVRGEEEGVHAGNTHQRARHAYAQDKAEVTQQP